MRYIILFTVFVLIFSACNNFLEEIPREDMTTAASFTSKEDAVAMVVGSYRRLRNWTSGAGDWGNALPNTLEYPTGGALTGEPHALFWRYQTNQVSGDLLDNFNNQWFYWYSGVQDCNFSIKMLPKVIDLNETELNSYLAEVRTLRAFYYFCIVRYWGDAVVITEPLSDVIGAEKPRTRLQKIYDEIIVPDLIFAVNSPLPDVRTNDGTVTKHVARAILSDVYLTMSGYPYQEVNGSDITKLWSVDGSWAMQEYPVNNASAKDFLQKAKEQLDMLYSEYELGTYHDLHDPSMNNKGEAIFQIQYLANSAENEIIQKALPLLTHISVRDENGTFVPCMPYVNSYAPEDKRIQDRQMFFYDDNISTAFDPNEGPADAFGRPFLYKYYDYDAIKVIGSSSLNWSHYRYADILLMLTEVNWALNETGVSVSDNDIVKGINEVRTRALLPAISASNLTLKDILSERAWELIFENKMLWDQRRTRKCLVYGNGEISGIENFIGHKPEVFSFSFSAMNLLSPIPGEEIANNKQMRQNAGYLPKQSGL
jgi:hypothetical protein